MTDFQSRCQDIISTTTTTTYLTRDQTTPLPQVATSRKNHNLFHYFVLTGVSAVSSESTSSRKCSLTRDFSFSSLSNFQNVNLLDKSQIPRSKVTFLKIIITFLSRLISPELWLWVPSSPAFPFSVPEGRKPLQVCGGRPAHNQDRAEPQRGLGVLARLLPPGPAALPLGVGLVPVALRTVSEVTNIAHH